MKAKKTWLIYFMLLNIITIMLVGCGGGGGSSPTQQTQHLLAGTAAAGAPIVGVVNVKGANGATASSSIDAAGHFSLDVSALTANYIMYAEGTVNGKTIRIYSAAVAEGNINITPITDLIVANAYQGLPTDAYSAWNGTQVSTSSLNAAQTQVQSNLSPLLGSAGVSNSTDLMTANFSADGTGIDKALDYIDVTYNGTTATVTNIATGSSYTNDVTNPGAATGLPPGDASATAAVMGDADGINVFWQKLNTLWATSVPSLATVSSQLGPYVADDLLDSGLSDTSTWLYNMVDNGPEIGIKITATILGQMSGTPYPKACWIRCNVMQGTYSSNFITSMVFDGTKWLYYGDRRWVEWDLEAVAIMHVPAIGSPEYTSGLNFWLHDRYNYASSHGVQSAIVTGPGLPAGGVVMELVPSNTTIFSVYQAAAPTAGSHYILSDVAISQIPDNATYTFTFYTAPASSVTLSVDEPVHAFEQVYTKAPIKTADLNPSFFPAFSAPTAHSISAIHIPGTLSVSWTSPANEYMNWVWLGWSDGSGLSWQGAGSNVPQGSTSTTVDMTTFGAMSPVYANLWTESYDQYDRMFVLNWDFQ